MAGEVRVADDRPVFLRVGSRAGRQRPRQAAEPVQIGPRTEVPPFIQELLGRHVCRRTGRQVDGGVVAAELGEPEVGDDRATIGQGEQDVRQLQVAVDHAPRVRVRQRVEQAQQQPLEVGPRQSTSVRP